MADIILNDVEISNLIQERKEFPRNYDILFQTKDKKGHREQEIILPRSDGSQFKVILRQNQRNQLAFSLILGYMPPKTTALIRLRRYNGKSHHHTNKIEKETFYDFHIHQATVSETLKRVETSIKREKKFQKEIEELKKQIIIEQ